MFVAVHIDELVLGQATQQGPVRAQPLRPDDVADQELHVAVVPP
jgi:hypothetical protein